jgi:serine/threonine protein kinase
LTAGGHAKVMDFGLAKQIATIRPAEAAATATITGPQLTEMGMAVGTPDYMSPAANSDHRQVLTKEPDLEHMPPQVRKLLWRCLEKDPKKRLRDIGEARFLLEGGGAL